jgi:hypothetical protein
MNHAVIYKTFPRHERGRRAKLTVAAKNKTFFGAQFVKTQAFRLFGFYKQGKSTIAM